MKEQVTRRRGGTTRGTAVGGVKRGDGGSATPRLQAGKGGKKGLIETDRARLDAKFEPGPILSSVKRSSLRLFLRVFGASSQA